MATISRVGRALLPLLCLAPGLASAGGPAAQLRDREGKVIQGLEPALGARRERTP